MQSLKLSYEHSFEIKHLSENISQYGKSHSSGAPRESKSRALNCFRLLFEEGRMKDALDLENKMWGTFQHFIPRQFSWDNSHTLYKVNLSDT